MRGITIYQLSKQLLVSYLQALLGMERKFSLLFSSIFTILLHDRVSFVVAVQHVAIKFAHQRRYS